MSVSTQASDLHAAVTQVLKFGGMWTIQKIAEELGLPRRHQAIELALLDLAEAGLVEVRKSTVEPHPYLWRWLYKS